MRKLQKILRYLIPYWTSVALNILFNFISVVFSLFSLAMVIPFLGILFGTQPRVDELLPFSLEFMRGEGVGAFAILKNNFYFYISQLIENQGEIYALVFVSGLVIIMSLLKTGFKYLAMYNLATIRNGVVKDMRNALYNKSVDLPLSYYSNERKGDIISRMTNDVHIVEWSIISSLEMLFSDPIMITVYLIGLLVISPHLTLFVLILLPNQRSYYWQAGKETENNCTERPEEDGDHTLHHG
jgi:ATP-binding cassette, subfamily B, bacterial MsbA